MPLTTCKYLAIFLFVINGLRPTYGQEAITTTKAEIDQLENQLNDKYGRDRLIALNTLTAYYLDHDLRKALRYGKQATALSDNLYGTPDESIKSDPLSLRPTAYNQLGQAYYKREKYVSAKDTFQEALRIAQDNQDPNGFMLATTYLLKIDSLASSGESVKDNVFSRTFRSLELGEKLSDATQDITIAQKINAAENNEKRKEYAAAIAHYEEAINLLRNKGDAQRIGVLHEHIAELQKLMGSEKDVIEYYEKAIAEQQKIQDSIINTEIPSVQQADTEQPSMTPPTDESIKKVKKSVEELAMESENYQIMAEQFEENKDFERAAEYRKIAQEYDQEIQKRQIAEAELTMLRQQKQIAELNLQTKQAELEEQTRTKRSLMMGAVMLMALAFALTALYVTKRKDHSKLSVAYDNLEETKSKLVDAEKRIKGLLGQQLSGDIAKELISAKSELRTQRKFVCVMFLDIRGFTSFAEKKEPEEIIQYQNQVFGFMIDIIHKYHGNINQFMGDGFMATFGAPISKGNDCQHAFDAACDIVERLNEKSTNGELYSTRIGIGLHAGHVVVGNVGTELRKQYSITGNTVIIAARIEQLNKKFGSQLLISEEVYKGLDHQKFNAAFEEVTIKGRNKPVRILKVL